MLLLGICLICSVNPLVLDAFPVESQVDSKDLSVLTAHLADPADYPDLTTGLSDAEVQESLKDLSLDDLNSLNKLLDERLSRDEDVDSDASQRTHGRQAVANIRKQDVGLDDGCRDEEDSDEVKPALCTKRPTCPTTRRCPKKSSYAPKTTRMCPPKNGYDSCKPKSGGYMDDDPITETTKSPKPKNKKCKKPKDDFECEADDFLCHASRHSRGKESRSKLRDQDISGRELAGNAQLGEELLPSLNDQGEPLSDAHMEFDGNLGLENQANLDQDQLFDLGKDSKINSEQKHQSSLKKEYSRQNFLQDYPVNEHLGKLQEEDQANLDQNYKAKFDQEQSTNLELRSQPTLDQEHQFKLKQEYQPNLDFTNLGNFEQELQANFDSENLYNFDKEHLANFDDGHSASLHQGEQHFNRNQKVSNMEGVDGRENEPIANEAAPFDPYERHQLSRVSHRKREQTEKQFGEDMHNKDDSKQTNIKDELMPLNANLPNQEHLFDSESFIANNARDPPRYLIQMQNDYIQSENDRGQRRLLEDRRESEALNMDKLTEEVPRTMGEFNLDSEFRREKRENKNTDDSPENRT
ncbi:uncharacterized protein LOC122613109 isoform X2 [Drosophila teissieri]|uniref:uncharacterized protein LOC122613109 isoform X2 n=1 Tax=Drosophila teissieri TaxID=7243 RepID=UPI001CBA1757|nr:uncharacterized protein LOC122613109 isoform X2 [Drosophila teissieri]